MIRCAQLSDFQAIYSIEQTGSAFPWTAGIIKDCLEKYSCWVMEEQKIVQGFLFATIGAGECEILDLGIAVESRRRGYARLLLRHLLGFARERGAEMVFLEVRASNHAAQALYESEGFNQIGKRKNYYPAPHGREDALLFGLQL